MRNDSTYSATESHQHAAKSLKCHDITETKLPRLRQAEQSGQALVYTFLKITHPPQSPYWMNHNIPLLNPESRDNCSSPVESVVLILLQLPAGKKAPRCCWWDLSYMYVGLGVGAGFRLKVRKLKFARSNTRTKVRYRDCQVQGWTSISANLVLLRKSTRGTVSGIRDRGKVADWPGLEGDLMSMQAGCRKSLPNMHN